MNIKEFADELQAIAEMLFNENNVQPYLISVKANGLESCYLDSWLSHYYRTHSKAENCKQDTHNWEIEGINIATMEHGKKKWKKATINYNYTRK